MKNRVIDVKSKKILEMMNEDLKQQSSILKRNGKEQRRVELSQDSDGSDGSEGESEDEEDSSSSQEEDEDDVVEPVEA